MAEAQLQQFLEKVRQLNAFVALSEADPALRRDLRDCEHHDQVVALARRCGFEIGRRWGEPPAPRSQPAAMGGSSSLETLADPPTEPPAAAAALEPAVSAAVPDPSRPAAAGHTAAAGSAAIPETLVACQAAAEPGDSAARVSGQPMQSLLGGTCPPPGEEVSELLIQTPLWRLERIHSCDYRSPDGFWYDQQEHEWVTLLQGSARLRCADLPGDLVLRPGDSVWLQAGRRHRVTATDPDPGTIWLALSWWTA